MIQHSKVTVQHLHNTYFKTKYHITNLKVIDLFIRSRATIPKFFVIFGISIVIYLKGHYSKSH